MPVSFALILLPCGAPLSLKVPAYFPLTRPLEDLTLLKVPAYFPLTRPLEYLSLLKVPALRKLYCHVVTRISDLLDGITPWPVSLAFDLNGKK
ncbi:hypothetical protein RRG08_024263 [Elysia crispata]|uniref:Secreted protein n=1 Tax=Elysia crispata TaxID=231223 RepID=A0AAE0Z3C9_9GAST|nr:hypothetical protein RRG08_024263 [Elysia crispata]